MNRFRILIVLLGIYALAAGCSSDPETPLGTEFVDGGLIGSEPGEVFQDTLLIADGDTSFAVNAILGTATSLVLGRKNDIETAMVLRLNFSTAGSDTARIVQSAELLLRFIDTNNTDTLDAHFITMAAPYTEGDTLFSLPLLADTIPSDTGVRREIVAVPGSYWMPPQLVEDWIRGIEPHDGFAVVLDDTTTTVEVLVGSRHSTSSSGLRPFLRVIFTDQTESSYFMSADGTFVTSLTSTTNLLMADGVVSRVFIPIDMTQIQSNTLLHDAKLVLHYVENSSTGGDQFVTLYSPNAVDIGDPGIFSGTLVGGAVMNVPSGVLELPVRSMLETFIASGDSLRGFVLRYAAEDNQVRQVEFHTGPGDSLKPSLRFTFSEAPKFPRP